MLAIKPPSVPSSLAPLPRCTLACSSVASQSAAASGWVPDESAPLPAAPNIPPTGAAPQRCRCGDPLHLARVAAAEVPPCSLFLAICARTPQRPLDCNVLCAQRSCPAGRGAEGDGPVATGTWQTRSLAAAGDSAAGRGGTGVGWFCVTPHHNFCRLSGTLQNLLRPEEGFFGSVQPAAPTGTRHPS